jgi:fermentation-respiration switch protein FrsA (DUF1100 family)
VALLYRLGSALSAPRNITIGMLPPVLKGHNVKFKSKTGSMLAGWFIPGKPKQGGILLMHGVRSNRTEMIQRAKFLNQSGYSILLFDFQAHGESRGDSITFGYLESQDAEAAYEFFLNKLKTKSIGIIGVSLGGAAALLGNTANQANAVIIEAVYPTFKDAVRNRMKMRLGDIGGILSPLLIWQIEPRLGFNPEFLRPVDRLANLNKPLLMIAGTNDQHTTLSQSKNMYNVASQPKTLWQLEGAKHQNFHRFSPLEYEQRVLNFFNQYL